MSNKLEQLEFKLEKIIGILKHAGKVRKERCALLPFSDMSCHALKILNSKLALYIR